MSAVLTAERMGRRAGRRAWFLGPLGFAVALNAGLLVVGGFVVVFRFLAKEEPQFVARPVPALPQKVLEQRVAASEFLQATSAPPLVERLTTSALLPSGLPALPQLPVADLEPVEVQEAFASDAQALLATAGFAGAVSGLKTAASAAAFFGIEDTGERIVIVVNTSASVIRRAAKRGVTIEKLQEEVVRLVEGLDGGSLFGIVQFSQGARTFSESLAPATPGNKDALRRWVPENLRGNPPVSPAAALVGHEGAFAAAMALEPDIIFLVTDGQLERREGGPGTYSYPKIPFTEFLRTVRRLTPAGRPPRVHVVGFEMTKEDAAAMQRLAREYKGQVREF